MSLKNWLPLWGLNRQNFKVIENLLTREESKKLKRLIKEEQVSFSQSRLGTTLIQDEIFPSLEVAVPDKSIFDFAEQINKTIEYHFKSKVFKEFAPKARETILKNIAPNIKGLEVVKEAAMLQLFAEQFHMLLLGDPAIGKTDIIRSASELAPIASFGLGSGTSAAGLAVTVKGNEVVKGLLPLAHNGIAGIDELNLMKAEDRASLYNAMEKGFVSYDKNGKHFKFDAKVSVMATANPLKDKFIGTKIEELKKQIPFDSALLSRFHLVFLIKTPGVTQFVDIAKKIVDGEKPRLKRRDEIFIQDYIDFAKDIDVEFPKSFQDDVVEFSRELKNKEKNFLVEISPRMIIGLIRLAKASARIDLREKVTKEDFEKAKEIIKTSLIIKRSV